MDNEIKKSIFNRKLLTVVLVVIAIVSLATFLIIREKQKQTVLGSIFLDPKENLSNTNGLTNIAVMGVGGAGHEAPDLTDSMMVASINHNSGTITLLPIPRDIWVQSMKAKINTAYYYGNQKRESGGLDLAKSALSEITGQPIHYAVIIDFEGFVELIDSVGGVQVNVERSFTDDRYPIPGKEDAEPESARYETLTFTEGSQLMDGETALKFARSRHAQGDEGTDFARSERQKKIITALLDQVFTTQRLLDLEELKSLSQKLNSSIDTDIDSTKYSSFLKIALDFRQKNQSLNSGSLEDLYQNPIDRSDYDGQWVLIPSYSTEEVHEYVKDLFNN